MHEAVLNDIYHKMCYYFKIFVNQAAVTFMENCLVCLIIEYSPSVTGVLDGLEYSLNQLPYLCPIREDWFLANK